ncbi:hypothetical protein BASA81_005350 [Batrachochytrium salamandrivorans]|nr:hypothetical protein BASA81_005350 [Batrachochytrium salamandrivorans]
MAAITNNIGLNIQKLAWNRSQGHQLPSSDLPDINNDDEEEGGGGNAKPKLQTSFSGLWACGMLMILLASMFDFAALGFGPQSVIAPLGALTMVANAFIAPCMNGEKLQPGIIKATIVILIGCIMAVGSASHDNMVCSLDALFSLYLTSQFCVYGLIIISILFALYFFAKRCERLQLEFGTESEEYQQVVKFHRITYAAMGGVFGAQSVLFARTVTQAFSSTMRGGQLFLLSSPIYLILFLLVGSMLMQIYWLNQGLARFDSLYNVPVFTSTWIVGTVLGGGVFYNEFASFNVYQAVFFPIGVSLCCIGVFYLAIGSSSSTLAKVQPGGSGTMAREEATCEEEEHLLVREVL